MRELFFHNQKIFALAYFLLVGVVIADISCVKKGNDDSAIVNTDSESAQNRNRIKSFWEIYRSAQDHRSKGEFQEARADYIAALKINDQHEDALFNLGNVCYELGKYGEAKEAWNKLIVVNPLNARAHFQLGNLYLRIESPEFYNLDSAETEFMKAMDLNRVITGPQFYLGQIELIRGNLVKADEHFKNVVATNERNVEAYFQLGYIQWKQGSTGKALERFNQAIEISEPEKMVEGVLSEGDTKGGVSHHRPTNQSLFQPFFYGLNGISLENALVELNKRYKAQEVFLSEIRSG